MKYGAGTFVEAGTYYMKADSVIFTVDGITIKRQSVWQHPYDNYGNTCRREKGIYKELVEQYTSRIS